MQKGIPYLFWSGILLAGCSIPIDPESFDYQRSVVVDGSVTDEFKQHEVSIQYSTPISGEQAQSLTATVWIETGKGEIINYHRQLDTYISDEPFEGKTGESYQLHFILENGEAFESAPSQLIKAPKIDRIYNRYAELAPEGAAQNEGGIQFFLDAHDETETAQYFRYEWIEDYKIITPNIAFDLYVFPTGIIDKPFPTHICYARDQSKSTIIGNSIETGGRIAEFPIRFISSTTDILRNRYCILVRQYAIDVNTYNFYSRFKKLNETTGSLFDKQVGSIPGNIYSLTDPDEVVLGYFEAAGVSEKRVFYDFEELDPAFPRPEYRGNCGPEWEFITSYDMNPAIGSWGRDLDVIGYYLGSPSYPIITNVPCTDCTGYGPTTPPDYWME